MKDRAACSTAVRAGRVQGRGGLVQQQDLAGGRPARGPGTAAGPPRPTALPVGRVSMPAWQADLVQQPGRSWPRSRPGRPARSSSRIWPVSRTGRLGDQGDPAAQRENVQVRPAGAPCRRTWPPSGSSRRLSSRSSVVLPAPDGPVSAVHAPAGIWQVTSSSSSVPPRRTVTCSRANSAGCAPVHPVLHHLPPWQDQCNHGYTTVGGVPGVFRVSRREGRIVRHGTSGY